MKGYKATDKDMRCRGFQFELGKWHEHKGKIELCESGFHFCKYPSGVYAYYDVGCRVFEVEAEGVLGVPETPGADYKLVCSRIKLVKEIFPDRDGNTGHGNTGNRNTGDRNTGDGNTGNRNTGDRNTGHGNTGHGNTGYFNAKEGTVRVFDVDTGLTDREFREKYSEWAYLYQNLFDGKVEWDRVKNLPGITKRKLNTLLKKHRDARKKGE